MDVTPQTIRDAGFATVRRGYDPDEVESFKARIADALEQVQRQATDMETRARAAVAKLQELSRQAAARQPEPASSAPAAGAKGELQETISRTLLLAQRTADATLADAREHAAALLAQGQEEAARLLDSARSMAARTIDDARHDARRSAEDERVRAENEVHALLARRDFLLADVDQLEVYLQSERERLREAANRLFDLIDRVPAGLGETRPPLLSASDTDTFWTDPEDGPPRSGIDDVTVVMPAPVPRGNASPVSASPEELDDTWGAADSFPALVATGDELIDTSAVPGGAIAAVPIDVARSGDGGNAVVARATAADPGPADAPHGTPAHGEGRPGDDGTWQWTDLDEDPEALRRPIPRVQLDDDPWDEEPSSSHRAGAPDKGGRANGRPPTGDATRELRIRGDEVR